MYENRYGDYDRQAAYENACDCLYYGCGKRYWNRCGVTPPEAEEIWRQALADMAKEE